MSEDEILTEVRAAVKADFREVEEVLRKEEQALKREEQRLLTWLDAVFVPATGLLYWLLVITRFPGPEISFLVQPAGMAAVRACGKKVP